jgi:DNA-binding response OmpR family regulator
MSTNSRRVLVVEDERDIARLLTLHLEDLGCAVDTRYDEDHIVSHSEMRMAPRGVFLSWIFGFRGSTDLKSAAACARVPATPLSSC